MSHQRIEDKSQLLDALRSISPPFVSVGVRQIVQRDVESLFDVELAAVFSAVDRRKCEFATGRVLLRELIGRDVAIPVADDRSPALPPGVQASLAHDDEFAVAAVSNDLSVLSLGIDVEPTNELEPDLAGIILRADESGIDPHLAFTLKEAAYKAWSNRGGRLLAHHDIRITLAGRRFAAEVAGDGIVLPGQFASAADRWLALVVVPQSTNR